MDDLYSNHFNLSVRNLINELVVISPVFIQCQNPPGIIHTFAGGIYIVLIINASIVIGIFIDSN